MIKDFKMQASTRVAIMNGDHALISLGENGRLGYAIVDIEDAPLLEKHNWSITNGYPATNIRFNDGGRKVIRMHQFLLGAPPVGKVIDHRNRKKLDNRRSNLRFVSNKVNNWNREGLIDGHKTYCVNGHEYTPENTILRPDSGKRQCRTCMRIALRRSYQRRKGKLMSQDKPQTHGEVTGDIYTTPELNKEPRNVR